MYKYNVQCTLYNVQCTMYIVQCIVYTIHCTQLCELDIWDVKGQNLLLILHNRWALSPVAHFQTPIYSVDYCLLAQQSKVPQMSALCEANLLSYKIRRLTKARGGNVHHLTTQISGHVTKCGNGLKTRNDLNTHTGQRHLVVSHLPQPHIWLMWQWF